MLCDGPRLFYAVGRLIMTESLVEIKFSVMYVHCQNFSAWCSLKGRTYLNKLVCLGIYDL